MSKPVVCVIGASSLVGGYLIDQLNAAGIHVIAFTRYPEHQNVRIGVTWLHLDAIRTYSTGHSLTEWFCLCPIWVIPEYFPAMCTVGLRRIVALSSTSRFSKSVHGGSTDVLENALSRKLEDGENRLQNLARSCLADWVILRPTLIYDFQVDRNLSHIAAFIRRYGFFPLLGRAHGRRQPVHALEVADAMMAAMSSTLATNRSYDISGGETLTYREMVTRIFEWLGRSPRFIPVPLSAFRVAISMAKILPKYRHLSQAMAQRMNQDLVFDHFMAHRDFGYAPGKFLEINEMREKTVQSRSIMSPDIKT